MAYFRLVLVAAALGVFLALVSAVLWYRAEATQAGADRDRAVGERQLAVDANAALQATVGRLQADAAHNDQIIAQMADDLDAIRQAADETNDAIEGLRETNADVAAYLHSVVPPELRKLLER